MNRCIDSKVIKIIVVLIIINILVYLFAIPTGTYGYDITHDKPLNLYEENIDISAMVVSVEPDCYIDLSEDEILELASLVYLEANTESYECQKAVASVVINRMTVNNKSLKDIIYEDDQFTPAHLIKYTEPTEININAVRDVMVNGPNIPEYVCYFRADRYHNWNSNIIPYDFIDNTYFSYTIEDKESVDR